MRRCAAVLALVAGAVSAVSAAPTEPGPTLQGAAARVLDEGAVYNIIDWDGGPLPPIYERSDQLPITLEDLRKLVAGKFSDAAIVDMLKQRRCACDVSVDALVELREAGVSETVLGALSLHALPPNRYVDLTIALDFEGLGGEKGVSTQARRGYLYLIVPDGGRERVFLGNLQAILAGSWQRDELVDRTDLLLPKKVRRVTFTARVPLKKHGTKKALVFASTKPDIYTSADIPVADRKQAMEFTFEYPPSSLQQSCRLLVLYRQDAMLPDRWHMQRSHFECEWD